MPVRFIPSEFCLKLHRSSFNGAIGTNSRTHGKTGSEYQEWEALVAKYPDDEDVFFTCIQNRLSVRRLKRSIMNYSNDTDKCLYCGAKKVRNQISCPLEGEIRLK